MKRNSRDPAGDIYSARFWEPSFRRREKCPQDQTPRLTLQLATPQVVERSATLTRTIILNLLMNHSLRLSTRREYLTMFYTGRFRPEDKPLYLFTMFDREGVLYLYTACCPVSGNLKQKLNF